MTLPELAALTRYWKRAPPVHVSVASYLGVGGRGEPAKRKLTDSDLGQVAALFGESRGKFRPPARMLN